MDIKPRILVVDDMPRNVRLLSDRLTDRGYAVVEANDGVAALDALRTDGIDLVLLDLIMPGMDGYEVLDAIRKDGDLRRVPVIVVTAIDQIESVVRCLELGADDYLCKPINSTLLTARVDSSLEKKRWRDREQEYLRRIEDNNDNLERLISERTADLEKALHEVAALKNRFAAENQYLKQEIKAEFDFEEIVTQSEDFHRVLETVELVATTDSTVLVLGETGTGKELLARAVHNASERSDRPLVKVNCAAIPLHLVESDLFGHERGAFTGAAGRKIGRFELADGGTIFLDEIGELTNELQGKLLRVLQEGEFERVGGSRSIRVDVRVIAATNRNLDEMVASGEFRRDLYYRINVFPITCPPLRDRLEDVPLLADHFMRKYAAKLDRRNLCISEDATTRLIAYDWPGNVRELENTIQRAMIISSGDRLEIGEWFGGGIESKRNAERRPRGFETLETVERRYIRSVLEATDWRIRGDAGSAEILGLKPTTLEARMKKLSIERPD